MLHSLFKPTERKGFNFMQPKEIVRFLSFCYVATTKCVYFCESLLCLFHTCSEWEGLQQNIKIQHTSQFVKQNGIIYNKSVSTALIATLKFN